jgi:hypothetical protein
MGIEFLKDDSTNGSSNIVLKNKVYYDFNLKFDCLLSETGTISVNFRQKDNFNYYSFIIDKNSGYKILSKNINGNMEILKKINDGAITINQWHTVIINMRANKISVKMYDSENKSISNINIQDIMTTFDSSFTRGTIGFNINGVKGFYFDEFSINPISCWSHWYPKDNIEILNSNASIYDEDFSGTFIEKYTLYNTPEEGDDGPIKEGPAIWSFQEGGTFEPNFIFQENKVWDSSPLKRTNYVILNQKHFQNGTYILKFIPLDDNGIISIIFKYNKSEGKEKEKYYVFEINNERDENSFDLKLINGNQNKTLASINASQINELNKKAYIPNKENFVHIDVINNKISIKLSHDYSDLYPIFNINDLSIKGGFVGFGTYKTASRFTTVRMYPPNLKMTPYDINKVLLTNSSKLLSTTPFPSAKRIEDVYQSLNKKILNFGESAYEDLNHKINSLASSLGYNFRKDNNISEASKNIESESNKFNKEEFKEKEETTQWKQCIIARTTKDRSNWCSFTFPSDLIKSKCEVNINF